MIRMRTGNLSPAVLTLAIFFLQASAALQAQVCDVDGVAVEFQRLNGGSLALRDAKSRELVGKNGAEQTVQIRGTQNLTAFYSAGALRVDELVMTNSIDPGLINVRLDRRLPNIWEVNFPRGLYEFQRKSDLRIELLATVINGEAVHISAGPVSSVELQVSEGKTHQVWWGGSNSLRRLRGDLEFVYTNLQGLARAGEHRASVNLCVNIRGHL